MKGFIGMSNKTTINHSYTELIQCFEEKRMNLKKKISAKEAVRSGLLAKVGL